MTRDGTPTDPALHHAAAVAARKALPAATRLRPVRRRRLRVAIAVAGLAVLPVLVGGCNIFGVLAYKVRGPDPIPPQYVPEREPMLVLVENYRNPAAVRLDAERLGRYIAAELRQHDVAPVVDEGALEDIRRRPGFASMTQGQVGQAAGARQVLYVNLLKFNVEPALGSEMIRGQVEATVTVVDARTGQRRWPADEPSGRLLSLDTPYLRTGAGTGPTGGGPGATEPALRDQMCLQMADRIGKLFHKWTPDYEGDADGR